MKTPERPMLVKGYGLRIQRVIFKIPAFGLLADTEIVEDDVEQIFEVDGAGNAAEAA